MGRTKIEFRQRDDGPTLRQVWESDNPWFQLPEDHESVLVAGNGSLDGNDILCGIDVIGWNSDGSYERDTFPLDTPVRRVKVTIIVEPDAG